MYPSSKELRNFITAAFDESDFVDLFCADYFPQAKADFTETMTFRQKIQRLIDYCQNRRVMDNLLAALRQEHPEAFAQRFAASTPPPIATSDQPRETKNRNPRQIFISHAHQDEERAHHLAKTLLQQGWAVWIAPDSIHAGEKWVQAIERGLDESGIFLAILTPAAIQSDWMRQETSIAIEFATRNIMRLIPVLVEPCKVPTMLSSYQHVSFVDSYEGGLAHLLAALEQQPPEERESEQHGPASHVISWLAHLIRRVQKIPKWGWAAAAVVVLALLATMLAVLPPLLSPKIGSEVRVSPTAPAQIAMATASAPLVLPVVTPTLTRMPVSIETAEPVNTAQADAGPGSPGTQPTTTSTAVVTENPAVRATIPPYSPTINLPPNAITPANAGQMELTGILEGVSGVLAWSSDNQYLAVSNKVYRYNPVTWPPTQTVMETQGNIVFPSTRAQASQPPILAAVYYEGISIWGTNGAKLRTLFDSREVAKVAFSPDGTRLAGLVGSVLKLWDARDGRLLQTVPGDAQYWARGAIAYSPDGRLLVWGGGADIKVWDAARMQPLRVLPAHDVQALAFAPDSTTLASASLNDPVIKLWNVNDSSEILPITAQNVQVGSLSFSPDGSLLAAGCGLTVQVWEAATGRFLKTLTGHSQTVDYLLFSPDGTVLLSSGRDGVRVWSPGR